MVLNGDDDLLWGMRDKLPVKAIYYGIKNEEAQVFGIATSTDLAEIRFTLRGEEREYKINVGGMHNLQNALAAVAVGRALSLTDDEIAKGLDASFFTSIRYTFMC